MVGLYTHPSAVPVTSDGWCAGNDNCPTVSNHEQIDFDRDGVGDACEDCPADPDKTEPGVCGCGVADDDNDANGVTDCRENELADGNDGDDRGGDDGGPPGPEPVAMPSTMCGAGMILWLPLLGTLGLLRRWCDVR